MMRKQNQNPNKMHPSSNKSIHSKPHSSTTPDANTSRINYKPKFIKKFINIQQDLNIIESVITPQESTQSAQTYLHSPASITQLNTIDIDRMGMKNKWKELYHSTKNQMEARTEKFDKSIGIFCYILRDIKKIIKTAHTSNQDKIALSEERIDSLLEAFEQFGGQK